MGLSTQWPEPVLKQINKISQGRSHILDKIKDGQVQWIINTSSGSRTTEDSYRIRRAALDYHMEVGVKTVQEFSSAG